MSYDKDLRRARRVVLTFALLNLLGAGWHAALGNWPIAGACVVWAGCCCFWRHSITMQQKTRDMGRLIEAGLHGMRQEIERGER